MAKQDYINEVLLKLGAARETAGIVEYNIENNWNRDYTCVNNCRAYLCIDSGNWICINEHNIATFKDNDRDIYLVAAFGFLERTLSSGLNYFIDMKPEKNALMVDNIYPAWEEAKNKNYKFFAFFMRPQLSNGYFVSLETNLDKLNHTITQTQKIPMPSTPLTAIEKHSYIDKNNNRAQFAYIPIDKSLLESYMKIFDSRPYMLSTVNDQPVYIVDNSVSLEKKKIIDFAHNRLISGAPGTGKSKKFEEDSNIELTPAQIAEIQSSTGVTSINSRFFDTKRRITFYPNYSYEDFVGVYKPIPVRDDKGNKKTDANGNVVISYEYVAGPFLRMLIDSIRNPHKNYLLIIEEINRAKPAAVFGDIFQLLDREKDSSKINYGCSEYTIETSKELKDYLTECLIKYDEDDVLTDDEKEKLNKFVDDIYIPSNMYIWATMNVADQGVFPMDSAFKRRWDFEYQSIYIEQGDTGECHNWVVEMKIGSKDTYYLWDEFRDRINEKIDFVEEDRMIGAYFLKPNLDEKEFIDSSDSTKTIKRKVISKSLLVEKLLTYLKLDVLRYVGDDNSIFINKTANMSKIRRDALVENKGFEEIINIDFQLMKEQLLK